MNRIAHLKENRYDLIVIGGGSLGSGIARDAAQRGLSVLLLEKGDFGSGTSSRTSKIVHGGIRYLEQWDWGLVFESLRERLVLQRIAPHLVHPLPFLIPVYRSGPRPLWKIRIGLWIYDALSLFRNPHRVRILSGTEMLALLPQLKSDGLAGGGAYFDSQMDDSRLVIENVLDARQHGASVVNYAKVIRMVTEGGRIGGVVVQDQLGTDEPSEIRGRIVVNAGGPWVTEIAAMCGESRPRIRMTQGTHIIVPEIARGHAVVVSPEKENRIFFVLPWHGYSLIGTTDIDFSGDPGDVKAKADEIAYLVRETRKYFPALQLGENDIISSFSGVRPLLEDAVSAPSSVSRRTRIVESKQGLISIAGGKMTTFRSTAERVVDRVGKRLARTDLRACRTAEEPLYGAKFKKSFTEYRKERTAAWAKEFGIKEPVISYLIGQYGMRAPEVLERIRNDPGLALPISPGFPHIRAEIAYAVEMEMALTLSDFLRRRTGLALDGLRVRRDLLEISRIMGKRLAWSDERCEAEVATYLRESAG